MLTHQQVNEGSRHLIRWDSFQGTWVCRPCYNFNHWHGRGDCEVPRCHCSLGSSSSPVQDVGFSAR